MADPITWYDTSCEQFSEQIEQLSNDILPVNVITKGHVYCSRCRQTCQHLYCSFAKFLNSFSFQSIVLRDLEGIATLGKTLN